MSSPLPDTPPTDGAVVGYHSDPAQLGSPDWLVTGVALAPAAPTVVFSTTRSPRRRPLIPTFVDPACSSLTIAHSSTSMSTKNLKEVDVPLFPPFCLPFIVLTSDRPRAAGRLTASRDSAPAIAGDLQQKDAGQGMKKSEAVRRPGTWSRANNAPCGEDWGLVRHDYHSVFP